MGGLKKALVDWSRRQNPVPYQRKHHVISFGFALLFTSLLFPLAFGRDGISIAFLALIFGLPLLALAFVLSVVLFKRIASRIVYFAIAAPFVSSGVMYLMFNDSNGHAEGFACFSFVYASVCSAAYIASWTFLRSKPNGK